MQHSRDHVNTDIIIIGAGASGLAAAHELARHNKRVLVLEARKRLGGRIHTQHLPGFGQHIESGAEFIHGRLPVTISLLKQYGIFFEAVEGDFVQVEGSRLKTEHDFIEHSRKLEKLFRHLDTDRSVEAFLDQYAGDDPVLKHSVQRFVEGYDAADITKASALAFKEEWLGGDDEQYRIGEGYMQLMQSMAHTCEQQGVQISLGCIVKEIRWSSASRVSITTADGRSHEAAQVLITVPLGVLQSLPGEEASISFVPPLPEKAEALQSLGYGAVIKFVLRFDEAFWKTGSFQEHLKKDLRELGFLFSDAEVPTWWTQEPDSTPILTGWLAGPRATQQAQKPDDELLELALGSLAAIFSKEIEWFRGMLRASHIANWAADPFAKGAYSYATVHSERALKILSKPVDHTLFFAGEAFGHGTTKSTVEAALTSGIEAAGMMLRS